MRASVEARLGGAPALCGRRRRERDARERVPRVGRALREARERVGRMAELRVGAAIVVVMVVRIRDTL